MTWLARVFRRERLEHQLDVELKDHFERQVADFIEQGLTPHEARRRTILAFGGLEQMKEQCRDARGTRGFHDIVQDIGYALRLLRRNPGFALVVIGSLSLGIGANAAIFSILDSVVLRPLPVRDPQRLAVIAGDWSNPVWEQIRQRQTQLFAGAVAWSHERMNLAAAGEVDPVDAMWVSGEFFDVLGVPAVLGRTIAPGDDTRRGGVDGPVAVISHRFWQQRFAGASDVLGRTLTLNRASFTIVGVAAARFTGPTVGRAFDVAIPIGAVDLVRGGGPVSQLDNGGTWWLQVMVRRKPDQTIDAAMGALNGVRRQIRSATMPPNWPPDAGANYLRDDLTLLPAAHGLSPLRASYDRPLRLVMGAVLLVLLITCSNVANLLLARANGRRHELSARLALGASPGRVARQLLTECLVLAVLSAGLGLAIAVSLSPLLVGQLSTFDSPVSLDVSLNWRMLAFATAAACGTAVLFGILPALYARRVTPREVLGEHARPTGRERRRWSAALVVAQIALSLVLVVGAGLLGRTFSTLARLNLGFEAEGVLLVNVDATAVDDGDERRLLIERARDAALSVPGVVQAGASMVPPLSGMSWLEEFDVVGLAPTPGLERGVLVNAVTPGFFAAYGTPLHAGRDFTAADRAGAADVVIVNDAFARTRLNGRNPVGHVLRRAGFPGHPPLNATIVGVVGDTAYRSVREPFPAIVYKPFAQLPQAEYAMGLAVRVGRSSRPENLKRSLADALGRVDARVSFTFRPLSDQVVAGITQERLIARLSLCFAALALLLAAIGVYGLTSYAVMQRRTEIGIRLALGAPFADIARLVVGRVGLLVVMGVSLGGALTLWASRFVAALLYGVQPRDPATFAGAAVVLAGVAAIATWIPANRASRIDPARVLREG